MKKRLITLVFLATFLAVAFVLMHSANLVKADNNVCCERLTTGAWCQSAPASACDSNYKQSPTACSQTNFCQVGTCVNNKDGSCSSFVSQSVCQSEGGVWNSKTADQLPQCSLGCCLLSEGNKGAQYTTQVKCKQLSSLYGVKTDFNSGITSEAACIAQAGGSEKGACVYVSGGERTCSLTTKTDCNNLQSAGNVSSVEFHVGDLCSNEELHTNCGPSKQTTCLGGQDEVYFVDTCGNIANIYDASKVNDPSYWQKIIPKNESCNPDGSNKDSASCGNCDYLLGSTCSSSQNGGVKPNYGNYYCKDLGCKDSQGNYYQQGESWCGLTPATPTITDQNNNGSYVYNGKSNSPDVTKNNLPGSSYIKLTCMNGKITQENCYNERQTICVQDEVNGFKNAACEANRWQDCAAQTNESDCLDRSKRNCQWEPNEIALGTQYYNNATDEQKKGACVPLNAPGFDFWNGTGNGDAICSLATIACNYKITKTLLGGKKVSSDCVDKNGDIQQSWIDQMQTRCQQIGDCGLKNNYKGFAGEVQKLYEKFSSK